MDKTNFQDEFKEFIDEGGSRAELFNIFSLIPEGDDQEPSFLELADQCILEVSSLVDETYANLSKKDRLAKKMLIMSKLLEIKASNLEKAF